MADTTDVKIILKHEDGTGGFSVKRVITNDQLSATALGIFHQTIQCTEAEVEIDIDPQDVYSVIPYVLVYNYGGDEVYVGIATGVYFSMIPAERAILLTYLQAESLFLDCEPGETATVEVISIGTITV